jgi:Secretion system C-terminal sorting domain
VETCASVKSNDFPIVVTGLEPSLGFVQPYPNPVSRVITIPIPGGTGGKIQLRDITGSTRLSMESSQKEEEINVSTYSAGVYLVTVVTEKRVYRTRFVKN